jgi:hypothetical protein
MKIFNKVALAAITGTILLSPAVAAQNTKSVLAADKALLVQGVIVAGVVAAGLVVLDDGIYHLHQLTLWIQWIRLRIQALHQLLQLVPLVLTEQVILLLQVPLVRINCQLINGLVR